MGLNGHLKTGVVGKADRATVSPMYNVIFLILATVGTIYNQDTGKRVNPPRTESGRLRA